MASAKASWLASIFALSVAAWQSSAADARSCGAGAALGGARHRSSAHQRGSVALAAARRWHQKKISIEKEHGARYRNE